MPQHVEYMIEQTDKALKALIATRKELILHRTMIVKDFMEVFSDPKIPTIARNVTDRAVSELLSGNTSPIDVTEVEWNLIVRYSGLNPLRGSKYTFIRIHDENGKEKDIQIENA